LHSSQAGRVALTPLQQDLEKALNESRKSEARLRKIVDTIPTLAWCNLPDGSNEFLNKRFAQALSLDEVWPDVILETTGQSAGRVLKDSACGHGVRRPVWLIGIG
jgi:PAS domain-containing protein